MATAHALPQSHPRSSDVHDNCYILHIITSIQLHTLPVFHPARLTHYPPHPPPQHASSTPTPSSHSEATTQTGGPSRPPDPPSTTGYALTTRAMHPATSTPAMRTVWTVPPPNPTTPAAPPAHPGIPQRPVRRVPAPWGPRGPRCPAPAAFPTWAAPVWRVSPGPGSQSRPWPSPTTAPRAILSRPVPTAHPPRASQPGQTDAHRRRPSPLSLPQHAIASAAGAAGVAAGPAAPLAAPSPVADRRKTGSAPLTTARLRVRPRNVL